MMRGGFWAAPCSFCMASMNQLSWKPWLVGRRWDWLKISMLLNIRLRLDVRIGRVDIILSRMSNIYDIDIEIECQIFCLDVLDI